MNDTSVPEGFCKVCGNISFRCTCDTANAETIIPKPITTSDKATQVCENEWHPIDRKSVV